MLTLDRVDSFYGRAQILRDLSFAMSPGRALVLLGRNGAGKSTTMKTIMGLVRPASGSIRFGGTELAGMPAHRIARLGIGYVPEDRRIFPELTVAENLEVGRRTTGSATPWTPARLFGLFPNLASMADRRGDAISGGEQQMLAVARTLMGNPRLLLLDEPAEGLAPVIVDAMAGALLALKGQGIAILLAEQNLAFARRVADDAVAIETGHAVWRGSVGELEADEASRRRYLAV